MLVCHTCHLTSSCQTIACCRSVASNNHWGQTCHAPLSTRGRSTALVWICNQIKVSRFVCRTLLIGIATRYCSAWGRVGLHTTQSCHTGMRDGINSPKAAPTHAPTTQPTPFLPYEYRTHWAFSDPLLAYVLVARTHIPSNHLNVNSAILCYLYVEPCGRPHADGSGTDGRLWRAVEEGWNPQVLCWNHAWMALYLISDDKTPIVCHFVPFNRIRTNLITLEMAYQWQLNDVWIIFLVHSRPELIFFQKSFFCLWTL